MKSKLQIITLCFFLSIFIFGVGVVSGVGQSDVLKDIKTLSGYYDTKFCNDITNISYGSLDGCHINSSSSFNQRYNSGALIYAFLGNLENNQTMINKSRDILLISEKLQEDGGDFVTESADLQHAPDGGVQSFILAINLAETYKRIESNLTEEEKNKIINMFRDYIYYITITPLETRDYGGYVAADRFSSYYYRKLINFTGDILNNTDNIHLVFRVNRVGNPIESNITIYVGEDTSFNYTYNTLYSNTIDNEYLELQLNKNNLLQNCPYDGDNYLCNFTFLKTSYWTGGDYYGLVRSTNLDGGVYNYSWKSSDGINWTPQQSGDNSSNEWWVYLKYFDNSTLDRTNFLILASNQIAARGYSCKLIYDIINKTNYPFSSNIAKRCYEDNINNVIINSKNSIPSELNEIIRFVNNTNTAPLWGGYSPHYTYLSDFYISQLWKLTGNNSYLNWLNNSLNNLSYFIYGDELIRASGFGSRGGYNGTHMKSLSSDWTSYWTLGFLASMNGTSNQANILANYLNSYNSFDLLNTYTAISQRITDTTLGIVALYEYFPNINYTGTLNTNLNRWIYSADEMGIFSIGTLNYRVYGSWLNSTSSGGVIGNLHKKGYEDTPLFSGIEGNYGNNSLGLSSLVYGDINNNGYSNAFDIISNKLIINNLYPYKLSFYGNLTALNTTKISNIIYNTTYTFYDDTIVTEQTTNANVELQLWSVSVENIGSGVINQGNIRYLNNATFLPINFNLNYNDSSNSATWGTVDKFNATGNNFTYLVSTEKGLITIPNLNMDLFIKNNETFNYNLSLVDYVNFLAFNTNGSTYGSTNINSNDGNINITLPAGNSSYVLDNFNITEGVSRANSPIWFSSSSNTEKHIASNLTNNITTKVLFDVRDCYIDTIIYIPNGSTSTNPSYTCNNNTNQITINSLTINPALNSNELIITYSYSASYGGMCSNILGGYSTFGIMIVVFVGLLSILIIVGIIAVVVLAVNNFDDTNRMTPLNINLTTIKVFLMGLLSLIILLVISMILIKSMCNI